MIQSFSMMQSFRILLFTIITLLSQNSFAGKAIIARPEPFYASETPFYDAEGRKRYLEEFENDTVLLVFWATWCGTCVNEMDSLDTLAKDFRRLPFKIIAVSQDYQGIDVVNDFYKSYEIRHLEAYHDYRNQLFQDMNVVGLPCAFIISPNNKVVLSLKGEVKWHDEKIRELILREIKGNPETPKNTYKIPSVSFNIMKKIEENEVNDNIKASGDIKSSSIAKVDGNVEAVGK